MPQPIEVFRGIRGCLLGGYRGALTGFLASVTYIGTRVITHAPNSSPPSDVEISTGGKSVSEILECFQDLGEHCVKATAETDFTDFAVPLVIGIASGAILGATVGSIHAAIKNRRYGGGYIDFTPTVDTPRSLNNLFKG